MPWDNRYNHLTHKYAGIFPLFSCFRSQETGFIAATFYDPLQPFPFQQITTNPENFQLGRLSPLDRYLQFSK